MGISPPALQSIPELHKINTTSSAEKGGRATLRGAESIEVFVFSSYKPPGERRVQLAKMGIVFLFAHLKKQTPCR